VLACACKDGGGGGDEDATDAPDGVDTAVDTAVDTTMDTDADVPDASDAADADPDCPDMIGSSCTGNWDCQDCSYCNGVEVCVEHLCEGGVPIDCSDTHECTADRCDDATEDCIHELDDSLCDDGVACNGAEFCDEALGCQDAPPVDCDDDILCTRDTCEEPTGDCSNVYTDEVCDDGDACTIDECDTTADTCSNTLIDDDGDTYPPLSCGGPDCDDDDDSRYPWAPESCTDGIDSNCNGLDDVSDPVCCSGSGDTCDCPVDLTSGGPVTGSTMGMTNDYCGTCGASPCGFDGADVAFYLSVPTTSLVTWTFTGMSWSYYVHLHEGACTGPEVACETSVGGSFSEILDPGYYFLILDSASMTATGSYSISSTSTPVERASGNDTCLTATTVTPGTTYAGSVAGMTDDVLPNCVWSSGRDAVFEVTLTSDASIFASTVGTGWDTVLQILDSTCTDAGSSMPCDDNSGGGGTSRLTTPTLAAGTYYIVVDESWSAGTGDYLLTVDVI
jgi:hypothetical protein